MKRRNGFLLSLILAICALCAIVAPMITAQEKITLTVPIAKLATSDCALDYLVLDVGNARITAYLKCNNGDMVSKVYDSATTPTGATLLSTLNTSNNSGANPSLIKKVYTRLTLDGVLTGTVSGTPQ